MRQVLKHTVWFDFVGRTKVGILRWFLPHVKTGLTNTLFIKIKNFDTMNMLSGSPQTTWVHESKPSYLHY